METYEDRVDEITKLTVLLPEPHKRMLEILCCHLEKVALKSGQNKMTVQNIGVCFGPTLFRNEEETVAAIIDIKFANVVVEILIENWRQILLGEPPKPFELRLSTDSSHQQLTVLPISPTQVPGTPSATPPKSYAGSPPNRMVSPPQRAPPPYSHPPPPPPGLAVYNNGPKMVRFFFIAK